MISASSVSPNNSYQLAYDALGRCIKRTVKGVTKYYVYDGEKPILEYKPAGALIGQNTYGKGIDEILMRWDPTITDPNLRTFYYQQDHEGGVTHLTNYNNGSGQIMEKYRYDVFGAPTIMAPGGAGRQASLYSNRFLFTGREWSAMFGFYEYRARAYHPGLGRFMSEDPKLFVRSAGLGKAADDWSFAAHPDEAEFNLFRYCDNDPIDFTDPMGEAPEWLHTTLDVSGTIEPTPFSDAINAGLYASEGNWANAGISIAGVIPYVGDIGKGGRLGGKLVKGLERAAQTTSRTKTERLLEHLTTRDLQGALKEARTGQAQGGQHLKEVAEAMHGLGKRIQQIKSSLSRGKLSEQQTQALQKELSEASKRLDNAEKYLGGTPPIQLK